MEKAILQVSFPPDWLRQAGLPQEEAEERVRQLFVVSLYQEGRISAGKAAEMLGVHRYDFVALLSRFGFSYFDYTPEELADEFQVVKEWGGDETAA